VKTYLATDYNKDIESHSQQKSQVNRWLLVKLRKILA